ncbi:MAG: transporter substrate-binding domain-containing protein [Desulfamplus sp.]|nr:transporter substrate-binding domain-containing protein [Desulfamplus sp.]
MKNIYFIIYFIIFVPLFFSVDPVKGDHIIIAADNWCPINCEPGTSMPGYMVETARKIYEKEGHTVEYIVRPWARAIHECRTGKINGIIGAFKGDAPDFIFPENELGLISQAFFVKTASTWSYNGIKSLEGVKLGAIIDYDYGEELTQYIEKNKDSRMVDLIGGSDPLMMNINKLMGDRIDVIIEVPPVLWYKASEMGVKDQLRVAGRMDEPESAYIAFSPDNHSSQKYADILSHGIENLRRSGELKKILEKYGLEDWK